MYENQTYQAILDRMLAKVPGSVDKREGGIIYDALAPAAAELAQMYIELELKVNLSFADTAGEEYLSRHTAQYGVDRLPAVKAIRKGVFEGSGGEPFDVPIGSRYGLSGVNYIAREKLADGEFALECETAGAIGNLHAGALIPIDYVAGLAGALLTDSLVPGAEAESDDALRARYYARVRTPASSGNKADYIRWAYEVPGVGGVQVEPLWDGPGTVKVILLGSGKLPASSELVASAQAYICPVPGNGEGAAPIGPDVTVTAAIGVAVDVSAVVELDGSRPLGDVQDEFEAAVAAYLQALAFASEPSVKLVKVGALLLDIDGVRDYSALELNEAAANVAIAAGEVAVPGAVTLSE